MAERMDSVWATTTFAPRIVIPRGENWYSPTHCAHGTEVRDGTEVRVYQCAVCIRYHVHLRVVVETIIYVLPRFPLPLHNF